MQSLFSQLLEEFGFPTDNLEEGLSELEALSQSPSPNFSYVLHSIADQTKGTDPQDEVVKPLSHYASDLKSLKHALYRLGRLYPMDFRTIIDKHFNFDSDDFCGKIGLNDPNYQRTDEGFPFTTPRYIQQQVLDQIREALHDDNITDIIIEAPTGVGKSGVAVASMLSADQGWLVTANKMLQSQYVLEFPWMSDFRGRSNYRCTKTPDKNCANAPCQKTKAGRARCSKDWACDYHTARSSAMNSPYTTMNLSALLIHGMYRTGVDTEDELRVPHPRPLLIIDEAHNLPEALTGVIEVALSAEKLEKIQLPPIPDFEDPTYYIDYLKQVSERCEEVLNSDVSEALATEMDIIRTLMEKSAVLADELETDFDNWVMSKEKNDELDRSKITSLKFNPIKVDQYWPKISYLGKKRIYLSATFIDFTTYMELLGLKPENTKIIQTSSPFPPERRPIFTRYMSQTGLNMGNLEKNLPQIAENIKQILDFYSDYKGIIHGNTYKVCLFLRDRLPADRILFPERASEQADMLAEHKRRSNSVLLSPSLTEGVDLKDEHARFQIIVKMPYPYLGDPLIRRRRDLYPGYYSLQTALTLIQSYGRTTRNENDWSYTFVMDKNFEKFVQQEQMILPNWFLSAVQQ